MKIKNFILTICIAAFSAATLSAQSLKPAAVHSVNLKNESFAGNSFEDRSFAAARANSPFASIKPVETASISNPRSEKAGRLTDYAAKFLGTRYVWGANGPKAFDCSGFTSYVFRNFGINLNRTSRMQYTQGEKVNVSQLQPGDLLFFSCRRSGRGNVGHVAIVASVDKENNTCTFIHASVKKGVTYQKFPDNGYFSRNFIGAKRILGTSLDKNS